jgi:hypothetical protein
LNLDCHARFGDVTRRNADSRSEAAGQCAHRLWSATDDGHDGCGTDRHADPVAEELAQLVVFVLDALVLAAQPLRSRCPSSIDLGGVRFGTRMLCQNLAIGTRVTR